MPEVKIRDLDPDVHQRLIELAKRNGRSMEAELREMILEAVGTELDAHAWKRAGFDEVHEVLAGSLYEVWVNRRYFRISVTRTILGGGPAWNSTIDECTDGDPFGANGPRLWVHRSDVPQRLLGRSRDMALRDAVRWLAEYAGVNDVDDVDDVEPDV